MENITNILPWKKAKTKRFNSVKPPKSRRLSLPSATDDSDAIITESALYGSTTSLPVLPLGGDGELIESFLNTSDVPWNQNDGIQQTTQSSRPVSSSHDGPIDVTPPLNKNLKHEDGKSSYSSADDLSSSPHNKSLQELLNDSHSSPMEKNHQSPEQRERIPNMTSNNDAGSFTKRTAGNCPGVNGNGTKGVKQINGNHTEDHDGPLSNQNGVIILNNVGVKNANEYDRLHAHTARNDNELSILLQELDTLISSLPESRRIGTPFSCSNFVSAQLDHRGGRIRLSEPDVCLCVPPGALPPGEPQTVYMYIVNPKTPALSNLGDEDHWLTPIVHCGPPGIKFRSHVALSLPSSVADETSWKFTVSRGVQPEYKRWESLENRDDSVVFVKSGRITVLVDHFTPYGVKGKPNSGDTVPSKWMEAGVFVHPPCGESGEQEVQFHVRIWNVADRQRVLQEERTLLRTCLAEPLRAIRVYDSGSPVQVMADEVRPLWVLWNHTGKAFPFQNLWREHHGQDVPDSPSISFVAQATQSHISDWHRGSFRATIRLFQQDHGAEGISFIVKANPDNVGRFVFKDVGDEYGTTLLRQQPCFDLPSSLTPSALFPLNEEHFHEVCLQLDGIATETGEKSWRAFASATDLSRKDLDAIRRCAQQHQHKSPSDLLLTYFVGDPCRGYDRLRTLQEIWYVLYHIGNNGAREEVEEGMYQTMTLMKGKPRQRISSDISSVVDHPSELSSLVMTSDEQMSDLEEDVAVAKDTPLESTAIADDYDKLQDTTENDGSSCSLPDEVLEQSSELSAQLPLDEVVESNRQPLLNASPIDANVSTTSMKSPSDHDISNASTVSVTSPTDQDAATSSSPLEQTFTDISDDLEMQLTEFSKHWAVSEDSLGGSSGSLSPASEAELLKILLADDEQTQLSSQNDVSLDLDDPQRQEIELPLNLNVEGNTNNNHSPTIIDLEIRETYAAESQPSFPPIAPAAIDLNLKVKVNDLDIHREPTVDPSTAQTTQESFPSLAPIDVDLKVNANDQDICKEPTIDQSTPQLQEGFPSLEPIDVDLKVKAIDQNMSKKPTVDQITVQSQESFPPLAPIDVDLKVKANDQDICKEPTLDQSTQLQEGFPSLEPIDVDLKVKANDQDICKEPTVYQSTPQSQESFPTLEPIDVDLKVNANNQDICREPTVDQLTPKSHESFPPLAPPAIDVDLTVKAYDQDISREPTVDQSTAQSQESFPPQIDLSAPPTVEDKCQDSSEMSKKDTPLESSADYSQDQTLVETNHENKQGDIQHEPVVEVFAQKNPLESDMVPEHNQSEKDIPNVNAMSKETQTPAKEVQDRHATNEPLSTHQKANGQLKPKQSLPKYNQIPSHSCGKIQSPGKTVVKIAYQTTDLEHEPTTAQQHTKTKQQNIKQHTGTPLSPRPKTNGTRVVAKQNTPVSSPPNLNKKQHRVPPRSPKREDRESLRKLARIALMGKQDNEDENQVLAAPSTPRSPAFDFSQLQPIRNKHEEFV